VNSSRWKAWLAAAAIFVLGLCIGGAGMAWAGIHVFRRALLNPPAGRGLADRAAERIGTELRRSLDLTPAEDASIQGILADTTKNLKAVRTQATAQVAAEFRSAIKRIGDALPMEKRAKFYRLVTRRYERLGLPPPQPDPAP
jgi:hypothetical protein